MAMVVEWGGGDVSRKEVPAIGEGREGSEVCGEGIRRQGTGGGRGEGRGGG